MQRTLLFGNGINRLSAHQMSWESLLNEIKIANKFFNGTLPNTMIYERAYLEFEMKNSSTHSSEREVKQKIANKMGDITSNDFYQLIFKLGFNNYLTTNYDYAFKRKILLTKEYTEINNSTEDVYSLRRNTLIQNKAKKDVCKIWNIHGEISKPISIMLGLDHYCGSIGKLDAYLKGNYEFIDNKITKKVISIKEKLESKFYDNYSWVELFFNSNIHILGLELDYSETDLWWMLNKRARIMNEKGTSKYVNNQIYYYASEITDEKRGLLESFKVNVVIKERAGDTKSDWENYYSQAISEIRRRKN